MTPLTSTHTRMSILPYTAFLALFLSYLGVLKTLRSSFWSTATPAEWLGMLLGFFAYWLALLLFVSVARLLTRRIWLKPAATWLVPSMSLLLAGVAFWIVLRFARIQPSRFDDLVVVAAILGAAALPVLDAHLLGRYKSALVTLLAVGAGIVAAFGLAHLFYLHTHRASILTIGSFTWMTVAGLAATAVWRLSRAKKRGWIARTFMVLLLVFVPPLVCRLDPFSPRSDGPQDAPNMLLITSDALRADYCSLYGGQAATPNLEALAQRGVLFEKSYSLAPWTPPSMTAMFSSTYPPGLTPDASLDQWLQEVASYQFDPAAGTLAEAASERAYATGGFVGNIILAQPTGILRGFQHAEGFVHYSPERKGLLKYAPHLRDLVVRIVPSFDPFEPVDLTRLLTDYGRHFMRRHRRVPFFLWIHHMDPHLPYNPPERFRSMEGPWPYLASDTANWPGPKRDRKTYGLTIDEEHRPYVRSLYEGEIRYVDESVGRLVAELERLGLRERTYICFTSDHGEEFWEQGMTSHGQSLYEHQILVPLVFAGPSIAPRRIEEPVSAIDLMPTLAELLGLEAHEAWQGESLTPTLRDGSPPDRPCFAQATNQRSSEPLRAVMAGDYKLIQGATSGDAQLFDCAQDPYEADDLAGARAQDAAKMRELLDAWSASFPVSFSDLPQANADAAQQQAVREQLRALGYID